MTYIALSARARPRAPRFAFHGLALCAAAAVMACSSDDDPESEPEVVRTALSPVEQENIAIAKRVLEEGLIGGDTAVIDELVREDYIQHNVQAEDGRAGLLAFVAFLQTQPDNAVEFHRELANGDYVALHSTYGTGDNRTVAFDVFRLVDGQLAEHWDALTPWVDPSRTESGNSLVDGETEVSDRPRTERNQTLVMNMVRDIFVERDFGRLPVYVQPDDFTQHNPEADDGFEGLAEYFLALNSQGIEIRYTESPLVVADGNFVLVGSEGYYGTPDDFTVFYDLFRVEDERVVEQWNVLVPNLDVDAIPHDNGVF
ncbi:MAG: nuclear transport factor 2 family protein [Polyangiaceae bacterium]